MLSNLIRIKVLSIYVTFILIGTILLIPETGITKISDAKVVWDSNTVDSDEYGWGDMRFGTYENTRVHGVEIPLDDLEGELLSTSGNTWRSVADGPSERAYPLMASIYGTDQVLMFGGKYMDWEAFPIEYNDTWVYDCSDNTWTNKNPSYHPDGSSYLIATIWGTDNVILYKPGETWTYDLSDNKWTSVTQSTTPPDAQGAMTSLYGEDKALLMVKNGSMEMWEYDLSDNKWNKLASSNTPSYYTGFSWVWGTDKAVVFGPDVWIYDYSDNKWIKKDQYWLIPHSFDISSVKVNYMNLIPIYGTDKLVNWFVCYDDYSWYEMYETWVYDLSDGTWTREPQPDLGWYDLNYRGLAPIWGTRKAILFGGFSWEQNWNDKSSYLLTLNANYQNGTFTSYQKNLGDYYDNLNISWVSHEPVNTGLKIQLRASNSTSGLSSESFRGPDGKTSSYYTVPKTELWSGHNNRLYIQYKAYFSTTDHQNSARLRNVTIYYDDIPLPQLVSPSSGSASSDNTPKFEWKNTFAPPVYQTAFQILIDDQVYFTSIDYDSGKQSSSNEYWQFPDGTSYTTIADGKWYWKVWVKDSNGQWGAYSNVGMFYIDTKEPTSAINEPEDNLEYYGVNSISGTSSDPSPSSGLNRVEVSIKRTDDSNYWTGSGWVSTEKWLTASGTTSWSYDSSSVLWTAGKQYTVRSRAGDKADNVEVPGTGVSFKILSYKVADKDIQVTNGGISGNYIDTHSSNNGYESIKELIDGQRSQLEHKWTITVSSGYNQYIFNIEAYHTSNSEGDDFTFYYSTDDITYNSMIVVTKTSDDNIYQKYTLPKLSGTVYIKVVDNDRSRKKTSQDTIYIDHMFIELKTSTGPNNPPDKPSSPIPQDNAKDIGLNPTISIYVSDPDGDNLDVTFYRQYGQEIGTQYNVPSGSRASMTWSNLAYNSYYYWYVVVTDSQSEERSDTWGFKTELEPQPGGMYVWDITFRGKLSCTATIRLDYDNDGIAEQSDPVVPYAVVGLWLIHDTDKDGIFEPGSDDDHVANQYYADSNGKFTVKFLKAPGGNYKGIVDAIYHDDYTYDPSLDRNNPSYYTI